MENGFLNRKSEVRAFPGSPAPECEKPTAGLSAVPRSLRGPSTKIHALADALRNPVELMPNSPEISSPASTWLPP
jgi:hypothetical protein